MLRGQPCIEKDHHRGGRRRSHYSPGRLRCHAVAGHPRKSAEVPASLRDMVTLQLGTLAGMASKLGPRDRASLRSESLLCLPPSGHAQTFKEVGVVFRSMPGHALSDIHFERAWRDRDGLPQCFLCLVGATGLPVGHGPFGGRGRRRRAHDRLPDGGQGRLCPSAAPLGRRRRPARH